MEFLKKGNNMTNEHIQPVAAVEEQVNTAPTTKQPGHSPNGEQRQADKDEVQVAVVQTKEDLGETAGRQ